MRFSELNDLLCGVLFFIYAQNSYVLPSNFEEVATGVLKVFNNLALVDIAFLQKMLVSSYLLLQYCHPENRFSQLVLLFLSVL